MPAQTKEGLKRVIGARGLAANIVNITVGAGIYVLPAIVAIQVGNASVLVYLFCAVMLISIMLCYAETGSRITTSGGSYVYVEAAFGPFAGFVVNWLFVFGWGSAGSAALMNVAADSLATFFPVFSMAIPRAILFFILTALFILVNIRGARQSMRLVELITLFKLLPLVAVIILGLTNLKLNNLHWPQHLPPVKTFGETALVLFFAFAGFETALNSSGEIENPRRAIPRGILFGGGLVFVAYIIIQTVTQGVLGTQISVFKDAPLAAVAERILGPIGGAALLIAAIVSSLGVVAGDILASPRLLFAGANDGLFPKFLGKVHPKFATPYVAIIFYAGLIFGFSISGGFKELAILSSGSLLLIYLSVVLATIKLRFKKEPGNEQGFKAPGGMIFPVVAIIAIVWLLSHLTMKEDIATAGFVALVCVIYFLMKLSKWATGKA